MNETKVHCQLLFQGICKHNVLPFYRNNHFECHFQLISAFLFSVSSSASEMHAWLDLQNHTGILDFKAHLVFLSNVLQIIAVNQFAKHTIAFYILVSFS